MQNSKNMVNDAKIKRASVTSAKAGLRGKRLNHCPSRERQAALGYSYYSVFVCVYSYYSYYSYSYYSVFVRELGQNHKSEPSLVS